MAEREARVVGFIVYNMRSLDDNIDNLVVEKEEQGKGVGKALVEFVEELARSRGYDVIKTVQPRMLKMFHGNRMVSGEKLVRGYW